MLDIIKNIFSKQRQYPVEVYGKLPLYKDFIATVHSAPGMQLKAWLLDSFQTTIGMPGGIWPFVYQQAKKAELIVGVIEKSSDGIREFPFTLFSVCPPSRQSLDRFPTVPLWRELAALMAQIKATPDINSLYSLLRGRCITLDAGVRDEEGMDGIFATDREGDWPLLMVARSVDAWELAVIKDNRTSREQFSYNWGRFTGEEDTVIL